MVTGRVLVFVNNVVTNKSAGSTDEVSFVLQGLVSFYSYNKNQHQPFSLLSISLKKLGIFNG